MSASEWVAGGGPASFLVRLSAPTPAALNHFAELVVDPAVQCRKQGDQIILLFEPEVEVGVALDRVADLVAECNRELSRNDRVEVVETMRAAITDHGSDSADVLERYQLELDAGFSFGSGSHPSTRLLIKLLDGISGHSFPGRVLDVGCGSGILALLAARMGAKSVLGVEVDAEAVAIARANVANNHLQEQILITGEPLSEIQGAFDLIMANLTASVFYRLLPDINRLLAEKGMLLVSGLQGRQADELIETMVAKGRHFNDSASEGKWTALVLGR